MFSNKYKLVLLGLVFTLSLVLPFFLSAPPAMAEHRQLIAIVETTAYKPSDGAKTFHLKRGETKGVSQVNSNGNWWIVDLAANAGRWKFKKSEVDFFIGVYPLDLSVFQVLVC